MIHQELDVLDFAPQSTEPMRLITAGKLDEAPHDPVTAAG